MRRVRLVLPVALWVVVLLALGHDVASPAVAQDPDCSPWRDPADFFPADEDLPAGYAHQPEHDEALADEDWIALGRFYARADTAGSADEEPRLEIFVGIMMELEDAEDLFWFTTALLTRRLGYVFESPEWVLGDEVVVGRRSADWRGTAAGERLIISFRVGQLLASVRWYGDTGDWGLDAALMLARLIEARLLELGPTRERPEGCVAPSMR